MSISPPTLPTYATPSHQQQQERENLLRVKAMLLQERGNNSTSSSSASVNVTLRSDEVNDIISAITKTLQHQQQHNRSPFSLQGQSLTDHPADNNSASGGSQQQVSLIPPPGSNHHHNHNALFGSLDGTGTSTTNVHHNNHLPPKSPEDPFARVQPFSSGYDDSNNNTYNNSNALSNSQKMISPRPPPSSRRRTQSVSFAQNENPFASLGSTAQQQQDFSGGSVEEFESRFSGLPIASRSGMMGQQSNSNEPVASLSPFDENTPGSNKNNNSKHNNNNNNISNSGSSTGTGRGFSLDMNQLQQQQPQQGVRVDDLQLMDASTTRRKSAVCGALPHLSLASPRREADYILFPEEETRLINDTFASVAQLYPTQFPHINDDKIIPAFDVNESGSEFDVLSFCKETLQKALSHSDTSSSSSSSTAERYTFVLVAVHVFAKYRFMTTFGADPKRLARFIVELLEYYQCSSGNSCTSSSSSSSSSSLLFTTALRAAVNLHCIHLILSDPKLGSQLTDIELAACLFATLAARASNLGVSNEFLFRSHHPIARLFPGWSPQEQVSVTIISELFQDFDNTNPFDKSWWMSDEELGESGVDAARRGTVFTELVADLILTTDTRHQQWLLKDCRDALQKAEGAAKGRARRGSIKFGDSSIIRVADMHRILRCLVHMSEQYAYILSVGVFDSFREWVARWILETRAQGAVEQRQGVPVTFHCRESTNAAEYHMQFMRIVVVPFVEMLHAVLPPSFTATLFENTQRLSQLHGEVLEKFYLDEATEQQQQQQQQQQQSPSPSAATAASVSPTAAGAGDRNQHINLNIRLLASLLGDSSSSSSSENNNNTTRQIRDQALSRFTKDHGTALSIPSKFNALLQKVRSETLVSNQQQYRSTLVESESDNNNNNNSNGLESAVMQTAMRLIDNRLRAVEMKYGSVLALSSLSPASSNGGGSSSTRRLAVERQHELKNIQLEVIRLVRNAKNDMLRPSLRNLNSDEEVLDALVDSNQTEVGSLFDTKNKSDSFLALLLRVVRHTI